MARRDVGRPSHEKLTFESLPVGVAGLGSELSAQPQHLTVGLWLYYREDPTQNRSERAALFSNPLPCSQRRKAHRAQPPLHVVAGFGPHALQAAARA